MKRLISLIIGLVVFCGTATAQQSDMRQINKLHTIYEHIRESYVDDVSLEPLVQEAIIATFKELDPHSKYMSKEEMASAEKRLRGRFAGIGIKYIIYNDSLVVRSIMDDSPAEEIDIMPNDRITAVNGQNIIGLSTDSIATLLNGDVGSKVTLHIERKRNNKQLDLECRRRVIKDSAISSSFSIDSIGYISIDAFTQGVASEFLHAYRALGDIKALIIDLRDNGGGLITSAIDLTSLFLNKGDIIVTTESRDKQQTFTKRGNTPPIDTPLVVLINENSASASEIFAGAIQDHDIGLIVGHTSFGKGLVQRIYHLQDGSGIYLTISRYKTPSGRIIQRPYTRGKVDAYISDSLRYMHPDSTHNADKPVYKTLKLGREVYGGGGIVPDRYIDISDYKPSEGVVRAIASGAIEHSIIEYIDSVSIEDIASLYPTFEAFNSAYKVDDNLLDLLYSKIETPLNEIDREYINALLMASIAEQLYGANARHYIYVSRFDPMARRAIMIAKDEII